jgi:hypothetical protein
MGYGMLGHIAIYGQQSLGTATSPDSLEFFPMISESLTTNIENLVEEGMRGRFEEGPSHEGLLTVEGDISFEPSPQMLQPFLAAVTGVASDVVVTTSGISTWNYVYSTQDFDAETALQPFTIQVHRDTGSSWQFTDSIVNALTIEITGNAIVKATATIMARVSSLIPPATAAYKTDDEPFLWSGTSVTIGGAANSELESLTITMENNVEGVDLLDTTNRWTKFKRTGYRSISISGVLNYASQAEYNKFRASSEQAMTFNIRGMGLNTATTTFAEFTFDFPRVRYTTFPVNAAGPGRESVSWEAVAKYDTTSANFVRISNVNTRTAYSI